MGEKRMFRETGRHAAYAAIGAALSITAVSFTSARAEDFYRGKQINIIVGSSAGGGYDTYARLLARHMPRYVEGTPTIVVQNMVGAGGMTAATNLANLAPKDGTYIAGLLPSNITEGLFGNRETMKYDPVKFQYLGSMNGEPYNCYVRADAPVQKFEDIFTKELIVGASASGASTIASPALLKNLLGAKFRVINGYPGSREITLAALRGEIQGWCGVGWSAATIAVGEPLAKGEIKVLFQENGRSNPQIEKLGVPRATDFAKTPEMRKIMDLIYSQQAFGRPFVLSGDAPADRVAVLRKGFMAAMSDAELIADTRKLKIELAPVSGEELQDIVTQLYSTPPELVEKARAALKLN
jgi:tripartite-type tricarboxylate transporter receptor subunit TctC